MKVLGISASPRKDGNSDILLSEALKGVVSQKGLIYTVYARDLDIKPCTECRECDNTGRCVIKDDMERLIALFEEVDHVILASPIFFYGIPSGMKTVIDRTQSAWCKKYVLKENFDPLKRENRKGVFLGIGATKGKRLFEGAVLTVKYFFDALDFKYEGELLIRGIDGKGEIEKYPEYLKNAYDIGKNLVIG